MTPRDVPLTDAELSEIEQIDRDAAASLIEAYWPNDDQMRALALSYRHGHNGGVWADAFAKHRRAYLALMRADDAVVLPEEPPEAVIRAVDKACHEHWPNARKMAVGMYAEIRRAAIAAMKGVG